MEANSGDQRQIDGWYVTEEIDGSLPFAYYLEVPTGFSHVELSTLRVSRRREVTSSDIEYRETVFSLIGSITAAGGHIEASMKRLLLLLRENEPFFEQADYQWQELENRLRKECGGTEDRRVRLRETLDWAQAENLRERRNTVVHGAWWLFDGCNGRISRWPRKAGSKILVGSGLTQWRALADLCWQFAQQLDDLIGEDWPRAILDDPPANLHSTELGDD